MDKQKTTKAFIEEFVKQRQEWKQKEEARLEEENLKILEFSKLQTQRENARQEAKMSQDEHRAKVQKDVSTRNQDVCACLIGQHYSTHHH